MLHFKAGSLSKETLLQSVESGSDNSYVNLQMFYKHCKYFSKNEIVFCIFFQVYIDRLSFVNQRDAHK